MLLNSAGEWQGGCLDVLTLESWGRWELLLLVVLMGQGKKVWFFGFGQKECDGKRFPIVETRGEKTDNFWLFLFVPMLWKVGWADTRKK